MKIINKKKIEELQQEADVFCKTNNSKIGVRIASGFLAGVSLCLLVSCSDDSQTEPYMEKFENVTNYQDGLAENELKLEQDLAIYLSQKTGVNIEMIDMREINLVRSSGNYLVITGKMINDVNVGTKDCTVTLKLSNDQFKKMETAMQRYVNVIQAGVSSYSLRMANVGNDVVAAKYSREFLSILNGVISDDQTEVEVIYDKNESKWLYEAPSSNR